MYSNIYKVLELFQKEQAAIVMAMQQLEAAI